MKQYSSFDKKTSLDLIGTIGGSEYMHLICSLTKFLMLFNLFERSFLNNGQNWYEVPQNYEIDETEITNELNFFKDRYYKDGKETSIFRSFKIYHKDEIKKNFKNRTNIFDTLLRISYQFRNNLYHGYKHICGLNKYDDCFRQINNFMIKVIQYAKEKDKKNDIK